MNGFIYHVASGRSLLSGFAFVAIGLALGWLARGRIAKAAGRISVPVGAGLMWLSSTPFPVWLEILLAGSLVAWLAAECGCNSMPRTVRAVRLVLLGLCGLAVAVEVPHWKSPPLPPAKQAKAFVVGDSISSGIDSSKPTWPALWQEQTKAKIVNLAKPGATLSSGARQAAQIPEGPCLVLIELGGNDLLGKPTGKGFETDLDEHLTALRKPGRTLVMIELPLLSGQAAMGRGQRTLAQAHGVHLIPKRFFARVLGDPEATNDGLHLSARGTMAMASMVREQIGALLVE